MYIFAALQIISTFAHSWPISFALDLFFYSGVCLFYLFTLTDLLLQNHFRFASKNTNPDKCCIIFNFSSCVHLLSKSQSQSSPHSGAPHSFVSSLSLFLSLCNIVWHLLVLPGIKIYPRASTTNPKSVGGK